MSEIDITWAAVFGFILGLHLGLIVAAVWSVRENRRMIQEFLGSEKNGIKKMGDNREWAWGVTHSGKAHGPFDTCEEALEDAKEHGYDGPNDGIAIGTCAWADPEDYLPSMDSVLEGMNDCAFDGDFSFADDAVFEVENPHQAEKDFNELITAWAATHAVPRCWLFVGESEED